MWHLIPTILYLTYVQGLQHRPVTNPYSAVTVTNSRIKLLPNALGYPGQGTMPSSYNSLGFPVRQIIDYPAIISQPQNYQPVRPAQFSDEPYNSPYSKLSGLNPNAYYYFSLNNLRQKKNPFQEDSDDYANSDSNYPDADGNSKNLVDGQSYYDDLELVDHFGNYLKRRTQLDSSSTALNDAAHQYNALLSVIIALARVARNSCEDFNDVYDQVYMSTVDSYFKYGLQNADKINVMIDEYIKKGNSRIPKLRKLKQELCEKDLYCSAAVDSKIKGAALLYVKELETLEALVHLARSFYPFIEEFNQAAQRGTVLHYLQNNKNRLKEYVMHVVNSVEHLTDKAVRCS